MEIGEFEEEMAFHANIVKATIVSIGVSYPLVTLDPDGFLGAVAAIFSKTMRKALVCKVVDRDKVYYYTFHEGVCYTTTVETKKESETTGNKKK